MYLIKIRKLITFRFNYAKHNVETNFCVGQPYIRLSGSNIPLEGRVEVFRQGEWGTVCYYYDPNFFRKNARVVCRELGFYDLVEQTRLSGATGKIWLHKVQCRGDEKSLVFCPYKDYGCSHEWDRYVKCEWHWSKTFNHLS